MKVMKDFGCVKKETALNIGKYKLSSPFMNLKVMPTRHAL
jgi:hypothetical protein